MTNFKFAFLKNKETEVELVLSPNIIAFNPYRPDSGQIEKINLKFLFSHFFVVPQKVL